MSWKIAEAKQRFSHVVRRSAEEPQLIYNRDRLVAVVVEPEAFRDFEAWRRQRDRPSLGDSFAELRALCEEEGYELRLPKRTDRRIDLIEDQVERSAR